jgi:hypothetical protein
MASNDGRPATQMPDDQNDRSAEKHYSVQDLCDLWQLSPRTIRRLFADEPDVIDIGARARVTGRRRRRYATLRIPQSVAHRVHCRLRIS